MQMISLRYLCTYDDSMIPYNTKVSQIHIFAHNSTGVNDTKKSMISKSKENLNTHILSLFPTFYVKY